jgi:hypothetical protein
MLVAVAFDTVTGEPPKETVAPPWNPVPEMTTAVPPPADPVVGATPVTVGAAT